MDLPRREWHYLQPPASFGVAGCACGNQDTQWSEFQEHCWCERCQIDFKPEHAGIFDGPVPMQLTYALGMRFDRILLPSGRLDRYDMNRRAYESEPERAPG